jgi:hypothetical protein
MRVRPISLSGEIVLQQLYTVNKLAVPPFAQAVDYEQVLDAVALPPELSRRTDNHPKGDIDLPFVSSYNTLMKIRFAGFFRPDHDPPHKAFSM